jgi:cyclopropane fatty-acyl-phospholipid synthase-like methyltransferase
MDHEQAVRQWDSAAPGWARWEPTIGEWLQCATAAMLSAAGVRPGSRVLDIACGAGDQSFAAARRVGPSGHVLATDISEAMIGFLAKQAEAEGLENIAVKAIAAEDLTANGALFDSVICRLGLMLMPDPAMTLSAALRMLHPGGRFAAIVVGSPEANPFLFEPLATLRRHANKPAPPPGSPGIFALADADGLHALVQHSGFDDVTVTTIDEPLAMASAADAVQMIKEAFGVYRALIGDQPEEVQQAAWSEVMAILKRYEDQSGLHVPAQLHVVAGQKPQE